MPGAVGVAPDAVVVGVFVAVVVSAEGLAVGGVGGSACVVGCGVVGLAAAGGAAITDVATVAPESPSGIAIGNRPVRRSVERGAADPRSEPDCAAPEDRCRAAERAGPAWAAERLWPASEAEPVEPADPVVSAAAMAGNDAIAAPTPSATASAPTRPT